MPDLPPVPDCEGPRLQPYQPNGAPEITFLDEVGQGAHGHVFKVQIDNKIFALKVFNYQLLDPGWVTASYQLWDKIDVELLTAQWHPFNAECRAYARLKEAKKEHLAVRCHGYLYLTEDQKKELEDRFGINSWWGEDYDPDTSDPEGQQELQQESSRPLCAIVKDFIDSDMPFGPQHAPMMVKNLHQLHRCGIVVHDMKEDAYLDGKLVDFSKAIVIPHIIFDSHPHGHLDETARAEVREDLGRLGLRFEEWNEEHEEGPKIVCDPMPVVNAVGRLRRGPLTWDEMTARCFNPREVKWQKFSSRPGGSVAVGKSRAAVRNSDTTRKKPTTGKKPDGISKRKAVTKRRGNNL